MSRVRQTLEQEAGKQLPAGAGVSASSMKSSKSTKTGSKKKRK